MERLKAMPIASINRQTLQVAIHDNIKVGNQLYTNNHRGYCGVDSVPYQRKTFNHSAKKYVDEFAFRLNEWNCEIDSAVRMDALVKRIGGKRLTYRELTK